MNSKYQSGTCPNCGFDLQTPALSRVWVNPPKGSSPEHLAGGFSDLEELRLAGYAQRNMAGWYIPTDKYKHSIAH